MLFDISGRNLVYQSSFGYQTLSCCSSLLDYVARHTVNHKKARCKDHPAPKQEGQVLCGGA